MNNLLRIIFAGAVLMFSANASAVMLGFGCITNNSIANCAIGESQLSLDVTDEGSDQVFVYIC